MCEIPASLNGADSQLARQAAAQFAAQRAMECFSEHGACSDREMVAFMRGTLAALKAIGHDTPEKTEAINGVIAEFGGKVY